MGELELHIYQAKDGWRWRAEAANGKIVAESGEAYTRRDDAVKAAISYAPPAAVRGGGSG